MMRTHSEHDRAAFPGVSLSELDPALTRASHRVIGAARDVHVALGPGHAQETYQRALLAELAALGITAKSDVPLAVLYKGLEVGTITAPLLIEERFVVQVLGQAREVTPGQRLAMRAVLRAGGLELGLIMNFGHRLLKDGLVRVINLDKLRPASRDEQEEHA